VLYDLLTMAAVITPGIDFILSALAKYGLPPFVVSAAIRTFSPEGSHMTSTWILVSASAISVPFIVSATIAIKRLRHRYQAWKLGARLAPEVQGRWIGNFDVLATLNDRFENDYPCASCYYPFSFEDENNVLSSPS
jgi:hypothetical protein